MSNPAPQKLDSWKDIAAYLKRDVSTVQRWEKREGMPVHRHQHDKLGSVYAFPEELDAWARTRRGSVEPRPEERSNRRRNLWIATAVIATIAVALTIATLIKSPVANPLANARFIRLTDFEGIEEAAAISRDGRFVAFLSDRDGPADVWVTQVGTGRFLNLTRGRVAELMNPDIRPLGFSSDGALVTFWQRRKSSAGSPDISVWAIPTAGGEPQLYVEGAAEIDWSGDGRLAYHTPAPGDPMFVRNRDSAAARKIYTAPAGIHNHYPLWSPDGRFIYFVSGRMPSENDVWRIDPAKDVPQRMTFHHTRVTHLAFIDRRTLLYLATDANGEGPWLYSLDLGRRESRRISFGVERYSSLAASADGRRLVATVADPRLKLWRVPIGDRPSDAKEAARVSAGIVGGRAPRIGPGYVLQVSSRSNADSIWKLSGDTAKQLWSAPGARVVGGAAISRDGRSIAFTAEEGGRMRLYVMNPDGSGARRIVESLAVQGAPAWSPDGRFLVVAAAIEGSPRLVRVSVADQKVISLVTGFASDPVWSPDGKVIVFSGSETGTRYPLRVVSADGKGPSAPNIMLSRGVRRAVFLPGRNSVVVLQGDMVHKNFWAIDLDTGHQRPLTTFGPELVLGDFDVSPDGREIIFDREQANPDIVMIER